MKNLLLCLNICRGLSNPHHWYFSEDVWKVNLFIQNVQDHYSHKIIINDKHSGDDSEFRFLPPHLDNEFDRMILSPRYETFQLLHKRTLNAFNNEHNKKLIIDQFDTIDLCGFNITTDIVPTALGLLDHHQDFAVIEEGCGDIKKEMKESGLKYMQTIGIKII